MKRILTITKDNRPAGVLVILSNSKGHILYDRENDGNKKSRHGWTKPSDGKPKKPT